MRYVVALLLTIFAASVTTAGVVQVCPRMPVATATSHQWVSAISAAGSTTLSQPAFTDISGSVASTQMPALTGDVTTTAGAVATSIVATTNSTLATLSGLTSASSLATVGTITSGTWHGSVLGVSYGGTGQASVSSYQPLCGGTTSTGSFQSMASGTTDFFMRSGGSSAIPTWSTLLADDGTNMYLGRTVGISVNGGVIGLNFNSTTQSGIGINNTAGSTNGAPYLTFWYSDTTDHNGTEIGSIGQNSGGGTAYNTTSDYRLKYNVEPMTDGLNRVMRMRPVTYDWKSTRTAGEGFIAHEIQEVVPTAVTGVKDAVDKEGKIIPQQVDYGKLTPVLAAAIQDLERQNAELKKRLDDLERKL